MEEKVLSSKENYNCIIKEIIKKNSENNIKITGKKLNYIKDITIIQFYCKIYNSTEINPFNSDINISLEFIENKTPYIRILNDFITPTLNDGRNIFYCLTNNHTYYFNINELNKFEKMFTELIEGIKNFLILLKENMEINVFILYGEYMFDHIYQINDFVLNKNIKLLRIIQINEKKEKLKYIVITQLYFLIFDPIDDEDMSLVKLEQLYYLKDIIFSLGILIDKDKTSYNLRLLDETPNKEINIIFYFLESLYDNKENIGDIKYDELKNILFAKKNEIDLKKYKFVIINYKPLFNIDQKKINKNRVIEGENMYNDYKLYIRYFEELINYYKDFKEENIKKRVKKYFNYLNYCCVDFITYNNSNPEEVKLYQSKIVKYLDINNS